MPKNIYNAVIDRPASGTGIGTGNILHFSSVSWGLCVANFQLGNVNRICVCVFVCVCDTKRGKKYSAQIAQNAKECHANNKAATTDRRVEGEQQESLLQQQRQQLQLPQRTKTKAAQKNQQMDQLGFANRNLYYDISFTV